MTIKQWFQEQLSKQFSVPQIGWTITWIIAAGLLGYLVCTIRGCLVS